MSFPKVIPFIHENMLLIAFIALMGAPLQSYAGNPDCTGPENWPASMAFVYLKNAGITDNQKIDFSKTRVSRIASEKIDIDLYRQVHDVIFFEKSGSMIEVITVNDASNQECSMSAVQVYLVAKRLGNLK